jgi:hypothetical protein
LKYELSALWTGSYGDTIIQYFLPWPSLWSILTIGLIITDWLQIKTPGVEYYTGSYGDTSINYPFEIIIVNLNLQNQVLVSYFMTFMTFMAFTYFTHIRIRDGDGIYWVAWRTKVCNAQRLKTKFGRQEALEQWLLWKQYRPLCELTAWDASGRLPLSLPAEENYP